MSASAMTLDKVNALLQAASDARQAFLERHNYVTRQTGSWEDTEYWAVHPLYLCRWENDRSLLITEWKQGVVPNYALINY
jgi:hypothetical protein